MLQQTSCQSPRRHDHTYVYTNKLGFVQSGQISQKVYMWRRVLGSTAKAALCVRGSRTVVLHQWVDKVHTHTHSLMFTSICPHETAYTASQAAAAPTCGYMCLSINSPSRQAADRSLGIHQWLFQHKDQTPDTVTVVLYGRPQVGGSLRLTIFKCCLCQHLTCWGIFCFFFFLHFLEVKHCH